MVTKKKANLSDQNEVCQLRQGSVRNVLHLPKNTKLLDLQEPNTTDVGSLTWSSSPSSPTAAAPKKALLSRMSGVGLFVLYDPLYDRSMR